MGFGHCKLILKEIIKESPSNIKYGENTTKIAQSTDKLFLVKSCSHALVWLYISYTV